MTYAVVDLETTTKTSYKRTANPFDADNQIVLLGAKLQGSADVLIYDKVNLTWLDSVDVLIGHNIKFDLLYLWDYPRFQAWLAKGGRIFDTMLAQYILDAQQPTSLALDMLAPRYGGTKKNGISKLIKAGRCTSELYAKYPKAVTRYLKGDLINTEIVAMQQLKLLNQNGQLALVKIIMDSVLATTEMEFNGLYINKQLHKDLKTKKIYEISDLRAEIEKEVKYLWPCPDLKFNPESNEHISAFMFGGELWYDSRQPIVENGETKIFKTGLRAGQIKTKVVKVKAEFRPLLDAEKLTEAVKKAGFYRVDDEVIQKVSKKRGRVGKIAELLIALRAANKELGTYYEGIEKLIQLDGLVHHTLDQCRTYTGRLSSRNPNAQNIPRKGTSEFKKVFTSRFGNRGVIIEADFKQLEVVAAAFLSGDEVLKSEITSGVDMHLVNAEWVFKKPQSEISSDERTRVKQQTFQLLYGASAYALSLSVGCSQDEAQAFIDGFYGKYEGIARWHKELEYAVYKSARRKADSIFREGVYKSITGRIYKFTEVQRRRGNIEFNLPDIKNYPVQGFATGDIVVSQLGRLYRALIPYREHIKLINTVHDSVMLDVKQEYAESACNIVKDVLECREWMIPSWNIDFDLPLRVDISIGFSWYDLINYQDYLRLNSQKSHSSQ